MFAVASNWIVPFRITSFSPSTSLHARVIHLTRGPNYVFSFLCNSMDSPSYGHFKTVRLQIHLCIYPFGLFLTGPFWGQKGQKIQKYLRSGGESKNITGELKTSWLSSVVLGWLLSCRVGLQVCWQPHASNICFLTAPSGREKGLSTTQNLVYLWIFNILGGRIKLLRPKAYMFPSTILCKFCPNSPFCGKFQLVTIFLDQRRVRFISQNCHNMETF